MLEDKPIEYGGMALSEELQAYCDMVLELYEEGLLKKNIIGNNLEYCLTQKSQNGILYIIRT